MTTRMLLLFTLLLSGCTFRAPQLEAALAMVRGGDDIEAEVEALAWTLEWLGERETVYPVVTDGLVIFTNPSDVQIVFDGWQVRGVAELLPRGRTVRVEVGEERLQMRFLEDGVLRMETPCEPWSQSTSADGSVRWTQTCEGLDEENMMTVDADGDTVLLRFVFHPSYPSIKLTKGSLASS